jgi:hypothetical protein
VTLRTTNSVQERRADPSRNCGVGRPRCCLAGGHPNSRIIQGRRGCGGFLPPFSTHPALPTARHLGERKRRTYSLRLNDCNGKHNGLLPAEPARAQRRSTANGNYTLRPAPLPTEQCFTHERATACSKWMRTGYSGGQRFVGRVSNPTHVDNTYVTRPNEAPYCHSTCFQWC